MAVGDTDIGDLNNARLQIETIEGFKEALAMVGITGDITLMENNNILIQVDTVSGQKTAIAVANISGGSLTEPEYDGIKVGDVSGGNYFEVEADGTDIRHGDATVWDEASQSFVGQNIFIVAGRVDYNFTELTLDFAANARYPEEPVGIVIQAMHARKTGSDIRPHIHWMQNSDANPNILAEYRMYNTNDVPPAWTLKALTAADNVFSFGGVGAQQITEFNLPAGHGAGFGLSFTMDLKIYRDSANTSGLFAGADTYVGAWNAKYYDIHFEKDMDGSRQEFVK